jgi:hypothetical protein
MAKSVDDLAYLLVLAGRTVLAADHIDLDLAVDQVGLKGVGILHNRHSEHQTDLAGHVLVLVPAVRTAVAVGQVGEDQKEERIHPVDQVGHLQVEHTDPIGVYSSVSAFDRSIDGLITYRPPGGGGACPCPCWGCPY